MNYIKKITICILLCMPAAHLMSIANHNNEPKKHHKKRHAHRPPVPIHFTPEQRFGTQAQGYLQKQPGKAIIIDGSTRYRFTNIITDPNPILPSEKQRRAPATTERIGYFSNRFNHVNMPITTYIFGSLLTKDSTKNSMGADPRTYSPTKFTPDEPFNAPGYIGLYFTAAKHAMIRNPQDKNAPVYEFTDVEPGTIDCPDGYEVIGSFTANNCNDDICSDAMVVVKLYGKRKIDDTLQ